MRRPRHKLHVSTFPFLAVLLCAMGALILFLLVMDRRAKIVAHRKAEEAGAARRAALELNDTARKEEWERQRAALHEALLEQQQSVLGEAKELQAKLGETGKQVRATEAENAAALKAVLAKGLAVAQLRALLKAKEAGLKDSDQQATAVTSELARLNAQVTELETVLADLKALKRQEHSTYSLVPYQGKRGDTRNPIYIECTHQGLILHPEKRALEGLEFEPLTLRSEVERRAGRLEREVKKNREVEPGPPRGPYVLFLIRPDGIVNYYRALNFLSGYEIDFGYELVDQHWALDFTPGEHRAGSPPWDTTPRPGVKKVVGLPPPPPVPAPPPLLPPRLSGGVVGYPGGNASGSGPNTPRVGGIASDFFGSSKPPGVGQPATSVGYGYGAPGTGVSGPGNGGPGNGGPGNGGPGNGASGSGASGSGASGSGAPGSGASGSGAPGNGASGNGASGNGASGNGASGNGVPGNGAPANGVPGTGAPGNGAPANGAPSNGAPANGGPAAPGGGVSGIGGNGGGGAGGSASGGSGTGGAASSATDGGAPAGPGGTGGVRRPGVPGGLTYGTSGTGGGGYGTGLPFSTGSSPGGAGVSATPGGGYGLGVGNGGGVPGYAGLSVGGAGAPGSGAGRPSFPGAAGGNGLNAYPGQSAGSGTSGYGSTGYPGQPSGTGTGGYGSPGGPGQSSGTGTGGNSAPGYSGQPAGTGTGGNGGPGYPGQPTGPGTGNGAPGYPGQTPGAGSGGNGGPGYPGQPAGPGTNNAGNGVGPGNGNFQAGQPFNNDIPLVQAGPGLPYGGVAPSGQPGGENTASGGGGSSGGGASSGGGSSGGGSSGGQPGGPPSSGQASAPDSGAPSGAAGSPGAASGAAGGASPQGGGGGLPSLNLNASGGGANAAPSGPTKVAPGADEAPTPNVAAKPGFFAGGGSSNAEGGGGGSGPGFTLPSLGVPALPGELKNLKPAPAPSPLGQRLGNRDFVINVRCFSDHVTVYPGGRQFWWKNGTSAAITQKVFEDVQGLIAGRQRAVAPGEPPYRPAVHFQLAPDGRDSYFRLYPRLAILQVPMSRENLEE